MEFDDMFAIIEGKQKFDNEYACIPIMGWCDDPEKMPKMMSKANSIFDYITFCMTNNPDEHGQAPYYISIVITRMTSGTDKSFTLNHMNKLLEFFKIAIDNNLLSSLLETNDNWGNIAQFYLTPLMLELPKATKSISLGVEVLIKLLESSKFSPTASSVLQQLQQNSPRCLNNYAEKIVELLPKVPSVSSLLDGIYKWKPEVFHERMQMLYEYFLVADLSPKIGINTLVWNIAKASPQSVKPFVESAEYRELLFSPYYQSMVGMTLKEVAVVDPLSLIDWIDDLKESMKQNATVMSYSVTTIIGLIGRVDDITIAKKCVNHLIDMMKTNINNGSVLGQVLGALKNVQDKHRDLIEPLLPQLKSFMNNPDTGVRNISQAMIDVIENRDLQSISNKVDETKKEITEVKQEVQEQNAKIEKVEVSVAETKEQVVTLTTEIKETKQEVQQINQRVDQVEVKVEEQNQKIQIILDKFDEMNKKVSESCKSYDELKAYIDQNVEMLKDFIGDIVKKMPVPFNFTAEGYIRRTLTLYFECDDKSDVCIATRDNPYKTETSDWAKWLKMSFTLCKLGKSLYDKSFLDAYGAVNELYNQYKQKEDQNFTAYISQPFLTSAEQDSLIMQLREQRFFDIFNYSSQKGTWVCVKCAKREHALKSIAKENSDMVEGDNNNNNNPQSHTVTKHSDEGPSVGNASPTEVKPTEKLQSHLKVSVGFMKRITKVWCVLENDKIVMFDKDKSKEKHTLTRKMIIDVKELDARVTKREHSFSIITRDRTYQCCAATAEYKKNWMDTLNKSM